jgi:hypothetical protein
MQKFASSDRSTLIRLASAMPNGNETRRAILAGLTRVAIEFDTKEALEKYLKDHPDADPKNHSLKKEEGGGKEKEQKVKKEIGRMVGNIFKKTSKNGKKAVEQLVENLKANMDGLSQEEVDKVWKESFDELEAKFKENSEAKKKEAINAYGKGYESDPDASDSYEAHEAEKYEDRYMSFRVHRKMSGKPPKV